MGEWVHHRIHGVGEVLARDGRERSVRFGVGVRRVDKMIRPLDENGIDVRAHRDQAAFAAWLHEHPVAVAVELLRERDDGFDEQQAIRRLVEAGTAEEPAAHWWRTVEPLLRQRDDVVVSSDAPPRYALRSAPDGANVIARASEILEQLAKKRATAEQRTRAAKELGELDRGGALRPALRGAAAALGVPVADAPRLAEVNPGELPADVVRRLLEREDVRFTLRAAVEARGPEARRAAAERAVASAPLAARARYGASVCSAAALDVAEADGDDLGATAERLATRVTAAGRLVSDGTTPVFVAGVLDLVHATVVRGSNDKQLVRLRTAAEAAVHPGEGDPVALEAALRLERVGDLPDDTLAIAWSAGPITAGSIRLAWLRALSQERPGVLGTASAWRGVDLSGLEHLVAAGETRRWLFESEVGRRRYETMVLSILRTMDRSVLGRLIAGDGDMLRRLPADAVRAAVERLAATDPALRVIGDGFAAGRIEERDRQHHEQLAVIERRAADDLAATDERVARAERQVETYAAEAAVARRLVQSAASSGAAAIETQQARLDGLGVAADILAEVERASGRSDEGAELAARLRSLAAAKGIRREAAVGAVVGFDHRLHRTIVDEDLEDGQPVTVVEPAWTVGTNEGVTAVRHGLVRKS